MSENVTVPSIICYVKVFPLLCCPLVSATVSFIFSGKFNLFRMGEKFRFMSRKLKGKEMVSDLGMIWIR